MKRFVLAIVCAVFVANPGSAQVVVDENGWFCGTTKDWETASSNTNVGVAFNNFYFGEEDSFSAESLLVLKIEFSAINRGTGSYRMNSQFIGWDSDGNPTFAVSASPDFDMLNLGTELVKGDVYITEPTLSRTVRICATFTIGQ